MARKTTKRATKKATRKKPAATGSRADTVKWAAKHMKKNPKISMTELKRLGKSEGQHVYPLIIGLARKELGWARPKPAATRRKAAAPGRRGPGRPPKNTGDPVMAVEALVTRMRELEREADSLRKALSTIADLAAKA